MNNDSSLLSSVLKQGRYIITLGVILFFVALILVVSFYSSIVIVKQKIETIGQNTVHNIAENSQNVMNSAETMLDVAGFSINRMNSQGIMYNYLQKYIVNYSAYMKEETNFKCSDIYGYIKGQYVDGSGNTDNPYTDISAEPWYKAAIEAGGDTVYLLDSEKNVITMSESLGGYGVIAVDIDVNEINKFMDYSSLDDSCWVIYDNDDNIIIKSSCINYDVDYLVKGNKFLSGHTNQEESGICRYNVTASRDIEFYQRMNNLWFVSIIVSEDSLYRESYILFQRQTIFSIVFCIIIIILYTKSYVSNLKSEEASKVKDRFLANMSHEIRTPMNGIIGMTEIAKQNADSPEKLMECIEKIDVSTKFLKMLINDILDMSRISSGKVSLQNERFSLDELADDMETVFRPQTQNKGILFRIERNYDNIFFRGDEFKLRQVIMNLLGNAVKFTSEGGITFTISTEKRQDYYETIKFSVKDTGIGIKAENTEKIFKPFEQSENNISREFGGTGLGLAISQSLVEIMGGKIEVISEENKGSEFFFSVNLDFAEPDTEKKKTADDYDFSGKRILLAEDNELNAEIAEELLQMAGFEVDTAYDGREACEMFEDSEPDYYDIILMDMRMPEMDGLEATKEIRSMKRPDAKSVIIIAMTANAFREDRKRAADAGMNEYLPKPVDVKMLYKTLKKITDKKEGQ